MRVYTDKICNPNPFTYSLSSYQGLNRIFTKSGNLKKKNCLQNKAAIVLCTTAFPLVCSWFNVHVSVVIATASMQNVCIYFLFYSTWRVQKGLWVGTPFTQKSLLISGKILAKMCKIIFLNHPIQNLSIRPCMLLYCGCTILKSQSLLKHKQ